MKKIIALVAALLLVGTSAIADSGVRRTPCGYQQLTSIDTAVSLTIPTTLCGPGPVTMIQFTAEAQAIRYRDDGVAPTAAVGIPIAVGTLPVTYEGSITKIQFISQTSGAKLNISYYK